VGVEEGEPARGGVPPPWFTGTALWVVELEELDALRAAPAEGEEPAFPNLA
jgi:hypothetical protein